MQIHFSFLVAGKLQLRLLIVLFVLCNWSATIYVVMSPFSSDDSPIHQDCSVGLCEGSL